MRCSLRSKSKEDSTATTAFWLLFGFGAMTAAFAVCAASPPATLTEEVTTLKATLSSPLDVVGSNEDGEVEYNGKDEKTTRATEVRSVVGDIEKLKKIGEILQTVGGKVIPVLVQNSVQAGRNEDNNDDGSDRSRGLQLIHDLKKEVDQLAKIKS